MSYTLKNLHDVEDKAVAFGIADIQEARFPAGELGARSTGFGHQFLRPGRRQGFAHRHAAAEEIYVVIGGAGRARLDDDIVDLRRLDALRVGAGVTRRFEAGPDGLEFLVFGPRHDGDAEMVQGFWED